MYRKKISNWVKFIGLAVSGVGLIGCILANYSHIRFSSVQESSRPYNRQLLPEKNDFKVAVFGDFAMQSGVAVPIMRNISASDADFAICTGDIFRHPGVGAAFYLRELFDENLHKLYFCVPGNHDTSEDGKDFLVYYRLFYGDEQYFFTYGDTLFVTLNTADNDFDEQRFQYLESVLEKYRNDYRRCILVTHIPPVEVDPEGDYCNKKFKEYLLKITGKYNISGIICGHLHVAKTLDLNGIPIYISHTSGQSNRDKQHPHYGYLMLHFKSDGTIKENYVFKPELERSRNYFYGFVLENVYGSLEWFLLSIALIVLGAAVFFSAAFIDSKKKPCSVEKQPEN